eukprot:GSMAST32.ASY1.ANO1.2196.1 assembled CDS
MTQVGLRRACEFFCKRNRSSCSLQDSCPRFGSSTCALADIEDIYCVSKKSKVPLVVPRGRRFSNSALSKKSKVKPLVVPGVRRFSNLARKSMTANDICVAGDSTKSDDNEDLRSSCYQRPVSEMNPAVVPFNSPQGRKYFKSAFDSGTLDGSYWNLSENYATQSDPAFCALTSLTVTLNSMGVDPLRKAWSKHPVHDENLVTCCERHKAIPDIQREGLSLHELGELASCNGVHVPEIKSVSQIDFESDLNLISNLDSNLDLNQNYYHSVHCDHNTTTNISNTKETHHRMIINFSRSTLGQTVYGHFSPIAAFEPISKMCLVLDVARFKYLPFWAPAELLFKAMQSKDSKDILPRGYLMLKHSS